MDINKDHGEIFKREKVYIYIKLYTHFIVQIFRNFSCFYCKFLIEQSCSWSRVGVGASGPRPRLWGGRPGLPTRRFPLSSRQPSGAPRPRLGGPGAREGRPEPSPSAFPFSSLRFHCHRFNIWIFFFLFKRKGKDFCPWGLLPCLRGFRRGSFLGTGPPASSPPSLGCSSSIFIFVLLLSWYKLLRRSHVVPAPAPPRPVAVPAPAPPHGHHLIYCCTSPLCAFVPSQ